MTEAVTLSHDDYRFMLFMFGGVLAIFGSRGLGYLLLVFAVITTIRA